MQSYDVDQVRDGFNRRSLFWSAGLAAFSAGWGGLTRAGAATEAPARPPVRPRPGGTMRLPNIAPSELSADQRTLYDKLQGLLRDFLQTPGFVTQKPDGTFIGSWNAFLHFPAYGSPAVDLFRSLGAKSYVSASVRELVILATAARHGALYGLYPHEVLAPGRGLSAAKVGTIAAGQRPGDLSAQEAVAYDVVSVLNRGSQVPNSTYNAAVSAFGIEGVAEIAYLVGVYGLICNLLNTFDVDLPGTETG